MIFKLPDLCYNSSVLGDWRTLDVADGCWCWLVPLQDLAGDHNLSVTGVYEFNNYIPWYIQEMEKIVADTYRKTRGKSLQVFVVKKK